jgi:hypothetical protein
MSSSRHVAVRGTVKNESMHQRAFDTSTAALSRDAREI